MVAPDPDDETGESRVLALTKHNLHRGAPSMRYRVEGRVVYGADGSRIDAAGIVWEGTSPHSASDLLAALDGPRAGTGVGPLEKA